MCSAAYSKQWKLVSSQPCSVTEFLTRRIALIFLTGTIEIDEDKGPGRLVETEQNGLLSKRNTVGLKGRF